MEKRSALIFNTLPSFLQYLEKNNLLKRISVEVDPELEITEIVNRLYQNSNSKEVPALLFEKVKGSAFPLVINLLGSGKSIEALLGEKPEALGEEILKRTTSFQQALQEKQILKWLWNQKDFLWRAKSARTSSVSTASFKAVKQFGEEVNLRQFPIMKCWPEDAGKFITAGLVITKSPQTGSLNMGIYRLQVLGANRVALHWQIQKGGGFHYSEAEALGEPLEVAVVLGSDPVLWLAGILPLPENLDEMAFAGFLRGEPLAVTSGETTRLPIPASAEIVLEGIALPGKRALEGPFGDHFGHYSHPAEFPVLEIKSVCYKPGAIFHSSVVGKPPQEDRAMGETVSKVFLPVLKIMRPELADLWPYYEAGFHNLLVVSVRQRYEKEALRTAFGLLGEGQLSLTKCMILVDSGVNPKDFLAVLSAVRENFNPEQDFILLPGTAQDTLDFTGPKINSGSKMILDATSRNHPTPSSSRTPTVENLAQIANLDSRILDLKVMEGALLVVRVKDAGREVLAKLLATKELQFLKMIAVVSEDVPLENDVLVLWGIFTRFDCQKDVIFSQTKLEGSRPVHSGTMGIDATWKSSYPHPVQMTAEIIDRVTQRWQDYGL